VSTSVGPFVDTQTAGQNQSFMLQFYSLPMLCWCLNELSADEVN